MSLDLLQFLEEKNVVLTLRGRSKKNILSCLLDHLILKKKIAKIYKKEILKILLQREEMGSTAIGGGIALPHARLECVKDIVVCVGVSSEGIDFDSLDGEPVYIVVLLLSNQKEAGLHLKMLAYLARILRDKYFVQQIREAKCGGEIISLLKKQWQRLINCC
jgi:mannitol/fructose-specific phosphotransferase system IIA component (Ntr-type)